MKKVCMDCGEAPTTKTWCKPCGYKNRKRPSGLTYKIVNENKGWFKFKGGHIDDKGYRRLGVKGKLVREHIIVCEKELGRKLEPNEVVHHINGDKLDNRWENLQVISKQAHDSFHLGRARKGYINA